jgi:hypothetical protein
MIRSVSFDYYIIHYGPGFTSTRISRRISLMAEISAGALRFSTALLCDRLRHFATLFVMLARAGLSTALGQPVVMTAPTHPKTAASRLGEIAQILALGLQRLQAKKSSKKSAEFPQQLTGLAAASERSWCTPV